MRVPSAQFSLPALRVGASAPIDVVLQRFQAHVLKHPLGLGAVLGLDSSALRAPGPRRWNHEGWDAVGDPPVVDLPTRSPRLGGLFPPGSATRTRVAGHRGVYTSAEGLVASRI